MTNPADLNAALIRRVGQLYALLRDCAAADVLQGEHAIAYRNAADGTQTTIFVHVDGTLLSLSDTPARGAVDVSTDVERKPGEEDES